MWKDSGQRNKSVRGVPRLQVKDKEMKIKKDKLNDNRQVEDGRRASREHQRETMSRHGERIIKGKGNRKLLTEKKL